MFKIENILIDEEVLEAKFSCDLKECKGACCTFPGENGAPLQENEINDIKRIFPVAKKYLSKRSLDLISNEGFFVEKNGEYSTNCIEKKDCVFVYYEGDVAKCSIEKAYFNDNTNFRKPISCHLFPIRVGDFGGR